jgi:hypothetical protein
VVPVKVSNIYPGTQKGGLLYNFINSILNEDEPIVSQDDVFDSMSVCFAVEKSIKQNSPVTVRYI